MPRYITFVFLLCLSACSSISPASEWNWYTFDLSGRTFSMSAPKGNFRDVYLPSVDLSKNEKTYVTLLSVSWVFSGIGGDKGGLDLSVGLIQGEFGDSETDFIRGIERTLSDGYKDMRPNGIKISNVRRKLMGGREWLCYSISNISSECALKVDGKHYVSWKLLAVNNTSSETPDREDLRRKIEGSLQIAF